MLALIVLWSALRAQMEPTRKPDWGLYQIYWSRDYEHRLARTLRKFATKPKYVMFYRDLGRPFPTHAVRAIRKNGAVPIVSLELWSWHGGRKGSYLPDIATGQFDDFFRRWATSARDDGRRVLLRFGFEFNGNWFTWAGDAKTFVRAWRRVHDLFRRAGADNVEWVWAPNVVSVPDVPANDMHAYYPGDAYVDWVAVDGYNFGDDHDRWHKWQSFEDIFGDVLRAFARKYPGKPVMISEFGCAPGEGGQRAQWIRDAFAALRNHPQVRAVVWFNFDKRREGEPNWRIDITPESLKAFNETFAAP